MDTRDEFFYLLLVFNSILVDVGNRNQYHPTGFYLFFERLVSLARPATMG